MGTPSWCAENVLKLGPFQSLQVRLRGVGACYLTDFRTVGEERSEMATVFGSYRSGSSLAFPGIYAGVLTIFPLPAVFVFTGLGMLATSLMTRFIPTRMR